MDTDEVAEQAIEDYMRKRLLDARAAVRRASVAFSNEPEWDAIHEIVEQLDVLTAQVLENRRWGVA